MADQTFTTKVYEKDGGDTMVVAAGGKIVLETGGAIVGDDGSQAGAIADLATSAVTGVDGTGSNAASKADVDTAFAAHDATVNSILAALRAAGIIAAA